MIIQSHWQVADGNLQAQSSVSALLTTATRSDPSPALLEGLLRLHISSGDSVASSTVLQALEAKKQQVPERELHRARVLQHVAEGRWKEAEDGYRELLKQDPLDIEASPRPWQCDDS